MTTIHATDGELTVLRRLAAIAYGSWSVDWPQSVPEDQRPVLDKDRQHGYVSRLDAAPGRMGRRFVRADIAVTAAEYDEKGIKPHSGVTNAEVVLDAAATQTREDAILERDITRAGLGDVVPGVEFDVGDIVDVVIWGKTIRLPVTAIEAVTSAGAVIDWRVKVGGQLIADEAQRIRSNAELERTIWQERRERISEVTSVGAAASDAKESARVADEKAETADGKAEDALQKWRDEKDRLDAFQTQQIHELEAYQAAIRRMVALQEPISGDISTYDPLVLGPVTITYPHRSTLKVEMTNFEFLTGVSVVMNARVDALSAYSWGTAARLSQRTPVATRSTGAIEYFLAANILVIPTADFSALLAQERKNRGLE